MGTLEKRVVSAADFEDPEQKKLKIDDGSSSPKQNKSDSSDYDSDAEYVRFHNQLAESDGFDVDAKLPEDVMSLFGVVDMNKMSAKRRQECDELAREAIKFHNLYKKPEICNLDLEFVKLLKLNSQFRISPRGELFFLTFEAKDAKDGSIQCYQAKVFTRYTKDSGVIPEVQMIRKKGDSYYIGKDPKRGGPCDNCEGGEPCGGC
ncbi:hypothetical protein SLEP1_g42309 [Rubroshorea leprosula]|uniref:Cystatin domain-containing protein n=1 Tax=Rubroshorea leprosula TaxID=152421 RepID=A0AAV5L9D8_9ROSI|nr:hypothetical protein SLEP1_g42309 [Rubroshorea leprosula]